jgi:hypothetical protein
VSFQSESLLIFSRLPVPKRQKPLQGLKLGGGVGLISSLGQSSFLARWNGFGYRNLGAALIGGGVGAASGYILGGILRRVDQ